MSPPGVPPGASPPTARPRLKAAQRVPLALEILRIYLTVRLLVRRGTITETVIALRQTDARAQPDDVATGNHLAWATVKTMSLLPTDSRCLMRSLVLTRVMARRGLRSEFVLSASTVDGFQAHAWIEHAGRPLLEPGGPDHQQLLHL